MHRISSLPINRPLLHIIGSALVHLAAMEVWTNISFASFSFFLSGYGVCAYILSWLLSQQRDAFAGILKCSEYFFLH